MEILLWLVPSVVVTTLTGLWVSRQERRSRRQVDREAAVARLGKALGKRSKVRQPALRPRERSSGVVLRRPDGARRAS